MSSGQLEKGSTWAAHLLFLGSFQGLRKSYALYSDAYSKNGKMSVRQLCIALPCLSATTAGGKRPLKAVALQCQANLLEVISANGPAERFSGNWHSGSRNPRRNSPPSVPRSKNHTYFLNGGQRISAAMASRNTATAYSRTLAEHGQRGPDDRERQQQRRKPVLHRPFLPTPRGRPAQRVAAAVAVSYLARSMVAARMKSESPVNPLRFAVVSSNAFSSAVMRMFTWALRVPSRAGVGGRWPSSNR